MPTYRKCWGSIFVSLCLLEQGCGQIKNLPNSDIYGESTLIPRKHNGSHCSRVNTNLKHCFEKKYLPNDNVTVGRLLNVRTQPILSYETKTELEKGYHFIKSISEEQYEDGWKWVKSSFDIQVLLCNLSPQLYCKLGLRSMISISC